MHRSSLIAGVDEAGRGPLAGPVFAAAVILDSTRPIAGLKDSKQLTEKKREVLFEAIVSQSLAWSCSSATVEEIEQYNILQASLLAMQRAVMSLNIKPTRVLIDGNQAPSLPYEHQTIIRGDCLEPAISAASIIAKVLRDRLMRELDAAYPHYGFAKHKGYGTALHLQRLKQFGPSKVHRKTFCSKY